MLYKSTTYSKRWGFPNEGPRAVAHSFELFDAHELSRLVYHHDQHIFLADGQHFQSPWVYNMLNHQLLAQLYPQGRPSPATYAPAAAFPVSFCDNYCSKCSANVTTAK